MSHMSTKNEKMNLWLMKLALFDHLSKCEAHGLASKYIDYINCGTFETFSRKCLFMGFSVVSVTKRAHGRDSSLFNYIFISQNSRVRADSYY